MRASSQVVLAGLLAVTGLQPPGCKARHEDVERVKACRAAFELCATPVRFRDNDNTDVAALDVNDLVELSSRQDLIRLPAEAAARLRAFAMLAATPALVEMEVALDENALVRCRCEEIPSELEKSGVRELVEGRLPPRDLRTPSFWAERVAAQLAATRGSQKRAALLASGGETDGVEDANARAREADRELCDTVHSARKILPKESLQTMVTLVYRRRADEAGEGSLEIERRMLREYLRSSSCPAATPIAPPQVPDHEPPAP